MTTLSLAPAYRDAIRFTLAIQIVLALFMLTILDGGVAAKIAGCAMAGFWLGAAIILLRRPRAARGLDLLYLRWGYFFVLILGVMIAQFIALGRA